MDDQVRIAIVAGINGMIFASIPLFKKLLSAFRERRNRANRRDGG
jgi:hypothetical protein